MKPGRARSLVIGLSMCLAAGFAVAITPTVQVADRRPPLDLEHTVPQAFGEWQAQAADNVLMLDAQTQATLARIYQQTLSRTYRSARTGERVMLVIAYGGDQSDDLRVHRPEVCYYAQGFQVSAARVGTVASGFGPLPVKRLVARAGPRNEPITYWVTMGDQVVVAGSVHEKLTQLRYGLTGRVPDGVLVRVSSIGRDVPRQYERQQQFIAEMLGRIPPAVRSRLIGHSVA